MTTSDPTMQNSTTTSFSDPVQWSEFDLGVVQENSLQETVPSISASGAWDKNGFDFSLDLPESYSTPEASSVDLQPGASGVTEVENQTFFNESSPISEEASNPLFISPEEASPLQDELTTSSFPQEDIVVAKSDSPIDAPISDSLAEASLVQDLPQEQQFDESLVQFEGEKSLNPDVLLEEAPAEIFQSDSSVSPEAKAPFPDVLQVNTPAFQEQMIVSPDFSSKVEEKTLEEVNSPMGTPLPVETNPQGKVLNLDEMISQFSKSESWDQSSASVQSQLDPFSAMKATLEAHHQENHNSQAWKYQNQISEMGSAPLSESMPVIQEVSPYTDSSTLNLEQLTTPSTNPLSNPTVYPQNIVSQVPVPQKKMLGIVLGVLSVVLVWVVAFMRFPDLFMFSSGQLAQPDQPQLSWDIIEWEHWSADLLSGENQLLSGDSTTIIDGDILTEFPSLEVEPLSEEGESDIQTIDLSISGAATSISPQDTENQESDLISSGMVDPLGAVEGLVGVINNNDLIQQELHSYQQRGMELKEQGSAQNKKTMMKYGLAVEKEAQKLLDQLANGENIDISAWSAKKIMLDDYLAKATNA